MQEIGVGPQTSMHPAPLVIPTSLQDYRRSQGNNNTLPVVFLPSNATCASAAEESG